MRAFRVLRGLVDEGSARRGHAGGWPSALAAATTRARAFRLGSGMLLAVVVLVSVPGSAVAAPEAGAYLGAQGRFTLDAQRLADRASVAVNVASGNLVVSASDLRIAGRQLGLSLSRTYNARGGGVVRTAGRDWVLSLGADNTLAVESDGDRTWRGPTGEEYRYDRRTDGTFKVPAGANAALQVNGDGTATITANRSGTVLSFSAASPGKLTRVTDKNGNHIDYTYGANGVSSIADTQGRSIAFTYWASGDLKTIADPTGRTWSYGYDANRRLTSYTDPEGGVWGYRYDASGRLDEITDPRSHKTLVGYDTNDRVTSLTRRVDGTTANDVKTSYAYSAASSPCATSLAGKTVVTDPRGKATTYCIDTDRQVVKAVDAAGRETSTTYTPNGDTSSFAEFGGTGAAATTTYSFSTTGTPDPTNNLTGGTLGAGESFSLTYHTSGTDPLAKFRVASTVDTEGASTFYGYDTRGNLTSVKDDASAPVRSATLQYNGDGGIATAKDGKLNQTTFGYDSNGNLTSVTPPSPTSYPGSPFGATTYTYDSLARVKTVTDGRGEQQEFFYDRLDRIVDIHYGAGHTHWVSFAYDGNGNLTAQTNDAGLDQAYVYDKLNRRVEEMLPETGFWNDYSYDKSSNLKTISDQNQTVTYSYDDVDRVTSITAPTESGAGTETSTYTYIDNASPRVRTVTMPSGATERSEYDKSGKISKVVSKTSGNQPLRERAYTYTDGSTPRGRIQTVSDENELTTSYSYRDGTSPDRSSLIEATTRDTASNVITNFRYAYDKAGNRTSRQVTPVLAGEQTVRAKVDTNEPGMAEAFKTTAQASGSTAALRVYIDSANTTSSVKVGLYSDNAGDPGTLLATATLSSPQAGKWNTVALTGASVTKGTSYWIAILQPEGTTGVVKFRDEPDSTGGPAQTSSQDTLTALPGTWSAGNNWPSAPISAYLTTTTAQTTSYAHNAANQLCWAFSGNSSATCDSPPAGATGYSYDEAGNELTGDRTLAYHHFHTDTISTSTGAMSLRFLGADQNQLWDVDGTRYQENLLGLSHQSTGETYVRDPDTGAVHSMTKNGDKRFFLRDAKDSTLGLLSPDETIERAYSYDPDGNATITGSGPKSVVQWVGGDNLGSQGIYHFGARLYNPAVGRWTQPDPLNQLADLKQANRYAYVGGDPINFTDPTGQDFLDTLSDVASGAGIVCGVAGVASGGVGFAACGLVAGTVGIAADAARGDAFGTATGVTSKACSTAALVSRTKSIVRATDACSAVGDAAGSIF